MGLKPVHRTSLTPSWLAQKEKGTGRNKLIADEKRERPKRERITGYWRKCHGEEIHNLYLSPNNILMYRFRRTVARYEMRSKIWFENLKRKSSPGRPRRRWKENNETYTL